MLGDASMPCSCNPSSTNAWAIGNPEPQPSSSTDAPAGNRRAHDRTVEAPIGDRVAMKCRDSASHPFAGSLSDGCSITTLHPTASTS